MSYYRKLTSNTVMTTVHDRCNGHLQAMPAPWKKPRK